MKRNKQKRKAYLENALAVEKYGVIPRTHYFDSDEAGADIYPTIEGMTVAKVRSALSTLREEKFFPKPKIHWVGQKISSDFSEIPGCFWYINIDQVEL